MRYVVVGEDPDDCWQWTGAKKRHGYGRVRIDYVEYIASRLSWAVHNEADPGDMDVCHKCDNPECTNPRHLFLGTHQVNMKDAADKGKRFGFRAVPADNRGSRNGMSKLTETDVMRIHILAQQRNLSQREIGKMFGINQRTVSHILLGKRWPHLRSAVSALEVGGIKKSYR